MLISPSPPSPPPTEGQELGGTGRHHQLHLNVTEVGTDRSTHTGGQSLQLFGPHIQVGTGGNSGVLGFDLVVKGLLFLMMG